MVEPQLEPEIDNPNQTCNFTLDQLIAKITDKNNYPYDLARNLDVSSNTISKILSLGEDRAFQKRAEILTELHNSRYRCEDILQRSDFGDLPSLKSETEQQRREKFLAELAECKNECAEFNNPEFSAKQMVANMFRQKAVALNKARSAEKAIKQAREQKLASLDNYIADLNHKVQALKDVHEFLESFREQFRMELGEDIMLSDAVSEKRKIESEEFMKNFVEIQRVIKKIIEEMRQVIHKIVHAEDTLPPVTQPQETKGKKGGKKLPPPPETGHHVGLDFNSKLRIFGETMKIFIK